MPPEFHTQNTPAVMQGFIQGFVDAKTEAPFQVLPMNFTPEDIRAMVRDVLG